MNKKQLIVAWGSGTFLVIILILFLMTTSIFAQDAITVASPQDTEKVITESDLDNNGTTEQEKKEDSSKVIKQSEQAINSICEEGYIFSEKDCKCVLDTFGCGGLDKENCLQNPNCYSFKRAGTCQCSSCEIYLEHQCLPK